MKSTRATAGEYARDLRRNMTREERRLWYDFLKGLPLTVRRQKVVGPYILDFYVSEKRIAIELDGSQHYDGDGPVYDRAREAFLQTRGITVIRYSNLDVVRNFRGVCDDICLKLGIEI